MSSDSDAKLSTFLGFPEMVDNMPGMMDKIPESILKVKKRCWATAGKVPS
jgi:hypothetical protein